MLAQSGLLQCWGSGGLVGDGTTEARTEPTPVLGLTDAVHVDSWVNHSCAVRRDGSVACWGQNDASQIEAAGDSAYLEPHDIAGVDSAVQVATSRLATCVLLEDGSVSCWADGFGATPTPVAGVVDGVAITAGHFHFCVRSSNGSVLCFGGENTGLEAVVPSPINDAAEAIAFHSETCYRDVGGAVFCWGSSNQPGQTEPPALEPISGLDDAILLANRCAVRRSGTISCWSERNALVDVTTGLQ